MEKVGVERVHGRPIRLFELDAWRWQEPDVDGPFTLLVAASASGGDWAAIRRFAAAAISSGCRYVCTWGQDCERVHDLFDGASNEAARFVASTWHAEESLAGALYFALVNAWPEAVADLTLSPVILAVEPRWIAETRRLVADQDELARLWVAE